MDMDTNEGVLARILPTHFHYRHIMDVSQRQPTGCRSQCNFFLLVYIIYGIATASWQRRGPNRNILRAAFALLYITIYYHLLPFIIICYHYLLCTIKLNYKFRNVWHH